jgi:subtilase family protein/BACON domain-containing protein
MKRLTLFLLLITFGILLATVNAFMQNRQRPRLGAPQNSRPGVATSSQLPRTYLNQTRLHKLIIKSKETAVYNRLAAAKAIRSEIDYGSYKVVVVDEQAAGGRAALQALPLVPRDDMNMIVLSGYLIDTSNPQPLVKELPADLKQMRMIQALAGAAPVNGLYIVQFAGPIQDAWYKALEKTGASVIAYAPNNAYVVSASTSAAGELIKMKDSQPFVQWLGDYEAGYKLSPELQARHQRGDSQPVRITVQVIDGAEGRVINDNLRTTALEYFGERRVLKYRNLSVTVPGSRLVELARNEAVFAIEEAHEYMLLDEAQGQIVAGNLAGNAPSEPGYLAWLASKGFDNSQFTSFAVNVVDDTNSLSGHPDLPDSRIAFEQNPGNLSGPRSAHGFINANIIAGFNDGTGQQFEDANGFNYGLGIAPWAHVGATAIFPCEGGNAPSPTEWEDAAYSRGSRISSNSWGSNLLAYYETMAQEYDSIVRDTQAGNPGNQQLAVVFAAGNFGPGADSVTTPATAKNVITVGASENVRTTGSDGCGLGNDGADSANDIASFSSRGPVFHPSGGDGRIKPDIMAPGTHIQSGVPQSNVIDCGACDLVYPPGQVLYGWSSGTSHSTPAVAGGAALVYQNFLNQGLGAPSPAMIKAVLMNSASYMNGAGAGDSLPSPNQGMGLMNLGRAFDDIPQLLTDQTQIFGSSGETYQATGFIATANQPLRVTLVWTDAPGSINGDPWVNDLDLEVTINGQTYLGNVFSGASSTTGGTADTMNNVESVFLLPGATGSFTVTVRATNIAGDGVPGNDDLTDQDFALVIYNANSAPPTSPVIGVNASNLTFTTVGGGPNPPNQTFSINNDGIGTLGWTASTNASWITVSQVRGTAPSTVTVSINNSNLSLGTYSGAIIINSPNAPNSPFSVPVKLKVLPAFRVDPSSLSFHTQLRGGNPVSQSISITPNDASLQEWRASSDAQWLMVSPSRGGSPSTLTVSTDISGLPVGTHTGTITINSSSPSALPAHVPVTLVVDGMRNGGFEASIDSWVLSGVAMRSTGAFPFSGAGYVILGGANGSTGYAYQQVTIPAGSSLDLVFSLNVTSSETAATARDRLFVEVCDGAGSVLATLATFSNLDSSIPGGYLLRESHSLTRFAGNTVRIQFRTVTDPSSVTSFRVDDVSVR